MFHVDMFVALKLTADSMHESHHSFYKVLQSVKYKNVAKNSDSSKHLQDKH